jgi:hypothetical protein
MLLITSRCQAGENRKCYSVAIHIHYTTTKHAPGYLCIYSQEKHCFRYNSTSEEELNGLSRYPE